MTMPPSEPGKPDPRQYRDPEAALGGADAVEKTTYVVGKGTEPEATNAGKPIATVSAGRGFGPIGWIVVVLVVLAVAAYALGFFR